MFKYALLSSMVFLAVSTGSVWAYFEDHDEYSLDLKGYSPELIEITQVTIDRFEGRYPKAAPTPQKKIWYNFLNNDWTASKRPFGYDVVDLDRYPVKKD